MARVAPPRWIRPSSSTRTSAAGQRHPVVDAAAAGLAHAVGRDDADARPRGPGPAAPAGWRRHRRARRRTPASAAVARSSSSRPDQLGGHQRGVAAVARRRLADAAREGVGGEARRSGRRTPGSVPAASAAQQHLDAGDVVRRHREQPGPGTAEPLVGGGGARGQRGGRAASRAWGCRSSRTCRPPGRCRRRGRRRRGPRARRRLPPRHTGARRTRRRGPGGAAGSACHARPGRRRWPAVAATSRRQASRRVDGPVARRDHGPTGGAMDADFAAYIERVRAHRAELRDSVAAVDEALASPIARGRRLARTGPGRAGRAVPRLPRPHRR